MERKKYVAYLRVSTKKQGASGLGLEAQREIVARTVGKDNIVKEFVEIESGRKGERPELAKAIAFCKTAGHTLAIAKLDRLSRSVSFIFSLKESGIDFLCCDLPELNTITLGIFASLAQYEAELISQRTKAALQAKRAQGFKLGSPQNLTKEAKEKGYLERRELAQKRETNIKAFEIAKDLRGQGRSYHNIADCLNRYGFKTVKERRFYAASVRNLFLLFQGKNRP